MVESRSTLTEATPQGCVVCGGDVRERFARRYDPSTGPRIYGPGSRNQVRRVSLGRACERCGIMYASRTTGEGGT